MATSPRYYELLEALPLAGCAICRVILADRDRYLDSLLYEYANTYETNQAFRDGRGLCNPHMDLLQSQTGNALGIAILSHATIDELLTLTENATPTQKSGLARLLRRDTTAEISTTLQPIGPCLVCQRMDETEASYLDLLNKLDADSKLWAALVASPGGFCLPHLRLGLTYAGMNPNLLRIQQQHWQHLHQDLTVFLEKYNLSNMHDEFGQESDSWRRAIRYIAGEPGVFALKRSISK